MSVRNPLLLLLIVAALSGCAALREPSWPVEAPSGQAVTIAMAIDELAAAIVDLDATIDPIEARLIAETSLRFTDSVTNEWQVVRPPLVHNMLVNAGMRPRGLCIHWTEDLLNALSALGLTSVDLYWVVAKRSRFTIEHSSVVVTSKNQLFPEGLVLDGWRNSGKLYWVRVADDKYKWKMFDRKTGAYIAQSEARRIISK